MKWKIFAGITVCLLSISPPLSAYEIHVSGTGVPAEFICPANKRPSAPKPAAKGPTEEVPDAAEVDAALANVISHAQPANELPLLIQDNRRMRVGLWGDSHAAANIFSDALVQALGWSEKRVLPSFIPPSLGNANVRLPMRACVGTGWRTENAYRNRDVTATWSRALTRMVSDQKNSNLRLDFRKTQLEGSFRSLDVLISRGTIALQQEAVSVLKISVNGGPTQELELMPARDGLLRIVAEQPIVTLDLSLISGSIGIDGFIPHYDIEPDLIFDTMGIPGATARGLQFLKDDLNEGQEAAYNLIMVEFGTNEGNNTGFDADAYARDLRQSLGVLRRFHSDATCILIGPTDRGVLVPQSKKQCTGKGKKRRCKIRRPAHVDLLHYAKIHSTISTVQAQVGRDYQCHAWSWQDAMGGPGGIYKWLRHQPALAQRDLTHLTGNGYRLSAKMFARRLLGTELPAVTDPTAPAQQP